MPQVLELYDKGQPIKDIAAQLKIDRHTAAKTVRHGLAQRGEQYVDGRSRAASLGFLGPQPPQKIPEDNGSQATDNTAGEEAA